MGDVSLLLRGSWGLLRDPVRLGSSSKRGGWETVMAERGKEQFAVVPLCFFTSVLKRETQDVGG